MAKQIAGLCFLVGTFDDLTCYKMEGQYYARAKSSLTAERVKTSPEFRKTMNNANLMVRASKIGSQIYKALPPGWRQFWMFCSFTGEALLLLKHNPYTDKEVKQLLWKCYVEYWEQRKTLDPDNPIFQPKQKKIRKRRKYSEESKKRLIYRKNKYGKYKYPDLVKADKEKEERELREAWAKKRAEKEQQRLPSKQPPIAHPLLPVVEANAHSSLPAAHCPFTIVHSPFPLLCHWQPCHAYLLYQPVPRAGDLLTKQRRYRRKRLPPNGGTIHQHPFLISTC